MKTDILFSSPHLRFSRIQQEAILAYAKELGAKDVPTLYRLEKFREEALSSMDYTSQKIEASSGNVFYMNSIRRSIGQVCSNVSMKLCIIVNTYCVQDYARPDIRPLIHAYPELRIDQCVEEVWHARKWLCDAPNHLLTPMVRIKNVDFYIKEAPDPARVIYNLTVIIVPAQYIMFYCCHSLFLSVFSAMTKYDISSLRHIHDIS